MSRRFTQNGSTQGGAPFELTAGALDPGIRTAMEAGIADAQKELQDTIDRYAIGSRTEGLKTNEDGSIDIYLQGASPGADRGSNWLPTPQEGNFFMVLRVYGPGAPLLEGTWTVPQPRVSNRWRGGVGISTSNSDITGIWQNGSFVRVA